MTGVGLEEPCPGCGAHVPVIDGPVHPYLGASPGCWQAYGELLARQYEDRHVPLTHRLTVDVYAAQHPGIPERRSRQSVAIHLMSLCLMLERGVPPEHATGSLKHFAHRDYPWLEPPSFKGTITVLDVLSPDDLTIYRRMVEKWARSVWMAWSEHHITVRRWLEIEPPLRI